MCNGTLNSYITSSKVKKDDIYSLLTINRIFQAIDYLHCNSLINRDIKPSNILLDHDFIPFVSDFDSIRYPNQEGISKSDATITNDIGSQLYCSPEQFRGDEFVSYPTDIYSFGLVIYFLYEKKDMHFMPNENEEIKQISNASENIKYLYKRCLAYQPNERIINQEIKKIINAEIDSFSYIENFLLDDSFDDIKIHHFLFFLIECILFQKQFNYRANILNHIQLIQPLYAPFCHKNKSELYLGLGSIFHDGHGIKVDYTKSIKYFRLSAELNNPKAFYLLGRLYHYGLGVHNNYVLARKYYEIAANLKDIDACRDLGYFYLNGLGVEINYAKAKEYYEKAARCNDKVALFNLGIIYERGLGVDKNIRKAIDYYEQSSKLKFSPAFVNLGLLYSCGNGVEQDYSIAKVYYEKAVELNNPLGFVNLGSCYEEGHGCPKDIPRAKYCYEQAAARSNSYGSYKLAVLYFDEKNYKEAIKYFEQSAKLKNHKALFHLGFIHFKGLGTPQNYLTAKNYFEECSKFNNPRAHYFLAVLYYNGMGVKKDLLMAKQYFELAAKAGNPEAFYILGRFNINDSFFGDNVDKAIQYFLECIKYYKSSLTFESPNEDSFMTDIIINEYYYFAFNDLGLIYIIYKQDQINGEKYLQEAAFGMLPSGQNNYGLFNQFYIYNIEKAKHFYERSSENNYAIADYNLGYLYEINGKIDESIKYYIKAVENKNEGFLFHNKEYKSGSLNSSRIFVICYTNFKLVDYYIENLNYSESKKYFLKIFSILQLKKFEYFVNDKSRFSYIRSFVLNHPFFNLFNQPGINLDLFQNNNDIESNQNYQYQIKFNDHGNLFDFIMQKRELKKAFLNQIKSIIKIMKDILYTQPYRILFGWISLFVPKNKPEKNKKLNSQKDINELFYEGFGFDLYKEMI